MNQLSKETLMAKRYVIRVALANNPAVTGDADIPEKLLPMTPGLAKKVLGIAEQLAKKRNQNVTFAIWVKNEDGSEKEYSSLTLAN